MERVDGRGPGSLINCMGPVEAFASRRDAKNWKISAARLCDDISCLITSQTSQSAILVAKNSAGENVDHAIRSGVYVSSRVSRLNLTSFLSGARDCVAAMTSSL